MPILLSGWPIGAIEDFSGKEKAAGTERTRAV
jgi:hypothetical protein